MTDQQGSNFGVDELADMSAYSPTLQMAPPIGAALSQGTTIEQSRAVAEAQAAVFLAQAMPRNVNKARALLRRSCSQPFVAEAAFYKFSRGDKTIRDLTVKIARELATCWGNIEHGITELARDDGAGVSEVKAWAWDQEVNVRSSTTFIIPHRRDRTEDQGGRKKAVQDPLESLRDIGDNNLNVGGRRLRMAIFAVLPEWFVQEARQELEKTIRRGDGQPLADRIINAVALFDALGVTVDRIEMKLGRNVADWTEFDIAELVVSHRSISRREVTIDEEFPAALVSIEELAQTPAPAERPEPSEPPASETPAEQTVAPPSPEAPSAATETPQEPASHPADKEADPPFGLSEDALRLSLKDNKLKVGDALRFLKEAYALTFGTLGDVAKDPESAKLLKKWIRDEVDAKDKAKSEGKAKR